MQLSRDVLRKRYSENMQQIYRRKPMPKYDFALRHRYSPVNLLHIFTTRFPKNTSERLLLEQHFKFSEIGLQHPDGRNFQTQENFEKIYYKYIPWYSFVCFELVLRHLKVLNFLFSPLGHYIQLNFLKYQCNFASKNLFLSSTPYWEYLLKTWHLL